MSTCAQCWSMFVHDNALSMLKQTVVIFRDQSLMDKTALEGCLMCRHLLGIDDPAIQWKPLDDLLVEFALNEARHRPGQKVTISRTSLWSQMSSTALSTARDLVFRLRWASNRGTTAKHLLGEASKGLGEARSNYRITLSLSGSSLNLQRYTLERGMFWEPQGMGVILEVSVLSGKYRVRFYNGAIREVTVNVVGDPATALTEKLTPCNDFESTSLWREASRWIEECRQNHARCNSNNVNIPEGHPCRILDLSSTQQGYIRLTKIKSPYPRYVALSYCWGGPQNYGLSTYNVDAYHRKISMHCLGRTIQDAVTACLRLGYHFLWVDSLCIIQDSDEDRANELGRMAAIYANADITLSAALSRSYDTGFLNTPPPVYASRPFLLPFRLPDGQTGKICLYKPSGLFHTNWPPVRVETVRERAWTMQERFMSRRLLIFQEHMLWVCPESFGHHGGRLTEQSYFRHAEPAVPERYGQSDLLAYSGIEATYAKWHAIVQEYSTKLLTCHEDKLPALSSIAEVFARSLSEQYLAGLWRGNIISDLLWTGVILGPIASKNKPSTRPPSRLTRPRSWRAPSWSFVSVEGHIRFRIFRSYSDKVAELIDCTVIPISAQAPYGQVESADIRLHAFLLPGRPVKAEGITQFHTESELRDSPLKPPRRVILGNVYYDIAAEKSTAWNSKNDVIESNYGVMRDTEPLWCCPLLACRSGTFIDLWGLVVARLLNGLYHRVGVVQGRWIPGAEWQFVCQTNPRRDVRIV
ncbi:HET domain-containing protein [Aspergillus melleus]|uniref:HET domain-containing protein n=1 Tax=Aspergillus melleus TaxID=138277 RepID=UPI001E8D6239|nr:uncharacterized protein LDX57_008212 [Aspergillus melleus]KAH8430548.1 hypothetical protein LDX57_008212 [Aspergillus melleus]